jgi:CheY-like chemotaxis protein
MAMAPPPSDLLSAPGQPGHNLLVVDEEVLSRLVIADYLRECGYRVYEAAGSDEAIEVLASPDVAIDLVLCDVLMPAGSVNGFALARWIREHHPDVKVVLSSGATRAADIAGELCEAGPQLKRPYDPQHAVARIKQLLAKAEGNSGPLGRRPIAGLA